MTGRILFGGLAAWFGRGANLLLGVVLLPVLFRHLSRSELGTWLLLAQSWAAFSVFDLGFGLVLTRRIAFAAAKRSTQPTTLLSPAQLCEIGDLVAFGRRLYFWLGSAGFGISLVTGSWCLRGIGTPLIYGPHVWLAWAVLCFSQAFGMGCTIWTCLLQGLGYVGWDAIAASLVNLLTVLAQIAVALLGGGILGLALAAGGGAILQRLVIIRFVGFREPSLVRSRGRWRTELIQQMQMLSPALRAWFTAVGYSLVANTDQLFAAASAGASALPAYRAAFLLVLNLHVLAGVFSAASPVFVSQLWQAGDVPGIRTILRRNARVGLWSIACGAGAILSLGPTLFDIWLGPETFIGYPILCVFLLTFALEHHANVFSTCARATDDEAYAASSIITGVLKLLLAWLLTARLGLLGLACSTLLAQATVNDWFMVYRSARRLHVEFKAHLKEVVLPSAGLFISALALGLLVKHFIGGGSPIACALLVSAAAGALLVSSFWCFLLESSRRTWLLRRCGWA